MTSGLSPAPREQPDPEWEPPGGPYDVLTTPSGRSVPPGEGRERSERGDSVVTGGHGYARTGSPKACRIVLLRAQAGWGAQSPPASTRGGRGLRSWWRLIPVWASVVPLIRWAHG